MRNRNNYTPDVLDCLANLSNDEVFTPPGVVNKMLDMLPKEVFMSKETTFLDPFTKSGVFLREITKRLLDYQVPGYRQTASEIELISKEAIQTAVKFGELSVNDKYYEDKARHIGDEAIKTHPKANEFLNFEIDLQLALDHILTHQVFGIAITELTAELSRRSLYCSKDASGRYSIVGTAFGANSDGNIRFAPMKHTWNKKQLADGTFPGGTSCKFCGASPEQFDRPEELETHAYEFIHKDIEEIRKELGQMEFTVICGNPPYQLSDGNGGNGSSAQPIYHKFIEQAKRLNPKYLTMIIPSRWMTGGKGLDSFRKTMLLDTSICVLHDFADSRDCFPGVSIAGGVCYFLRDREYRGKCDCWRHDCAGTSLSNRYLMEDGADVFIRQNELISIKDKVWRTQPESFSRIVSARKPYGLAADTMRLPSKYGLPSMHKTKATGDYEIYGLGEKGKRTWMYVDVDYPFVHNQGLNKYKLFISKANGAIGTIGEVEQTSVIGDLILAFPGQLCTETFLQIGPFDTQVEAENVLSYMRTKFFRALVSIKKQSQNMNQSTYEFAPLLPFDKPWTDEELYVKYGLTQEEIAFIESMIKPME